MTRLLLSLLLMLPAPALAQAPKLPPAIQKQLDDYTRARQAFLAESAAYWDEIAARRKIRAQKRRSGEPVTRDDYVLTQPPVYTGPPRPRHPLIPERDETVPPRPFVPTLTDMLAAARQHYDFVPERVGERDFKRAYAQAARAAGLTREQILRVYAFETGGNGTHDLQAGVNPSKPESRPISHAVGYNQLLATNSVSLLAHHGEDFVRALDETAAAGADRNHLVRKIETLRRLVAASRTVPRNWAAQDAFANTPQGYALHAAVLDRDIGPLLQVRKLVNSVLYARRNGVTRALTGAELELMNFTGDGNGIDIVTMPENLRAIVPTANFFQQRGYERNPIARRTGTVARLIADIDARMDRALQAPGARELAASF
jgi:hypothetical protein